MRYLRGKQYDPRIKEENMPDNEFENMPDITTLEQASEILRRALLEIRELKEDIE